MIPWFQYDGTVPTASTTPMIRAIIRIMMPIIAQIWNARTVLGAARPRSSSARSANPSPQSVTTCHALAHDKGRWGVPLAYVSASIVPVHHQREEGGSLLCLDGRQGSTNPFITNLEQGGNAQERLRDTAHKRSHPNNCVDRYARSAPSPYRSEMGFPNAREGDPSHTPQSTRPYRAAPRSATSGLFAVWTAAYVGQNV